MSIIKEFREFAIRGNVVELAIGVVIGAAFGKVVDSLVKDVIMPPIGKLLGNIDFSELYITLGATRYENLEAARAAGAVTINYGVFFNTVISFLIVAATMFLVVKTMNRLHRKEKAEVAKKKCTECLSEIPLEARRCSACTSTQ